MVLARAQNGGRSQQDQRGLIKLGATAPTSEGRTALVIGNAAYTEGRLNNPVNDATAIAAALQEMGFQVTVLRDADLRAIDDAVNTFSNKLRQGGVGLFYFAGHGLQVQGENYLVPIGARIDREQDVKYAAVPVGRVLGALEDAGNNLNIIILDACRNNPFSRSFRSSQMGLAQVQAVTGSLIAYATAPGSVAADGTGSNGVYTSHLLKNMRMPGVPIEQVFKNVRIGVKQETGGKQIPWEASSLTGDFMFIPSTQQISSGQMTQSAPVSLPPTIPASQPPISSGQMTQSAPVSSPPTIPVSQYGNPSSAQVASLPPSQVQPPPSKLSQEFAGQRAIIDTKFGSMEIRFFPDKAPKHVENFIKLAKSSFYDKTIFHRVIPGFMIQGGDPNTKDEKDKSRYGMGGPGTHVKAEFNDRPHVRGIISMARAQGPDSAGSQFFIVVKDTPHLNGKYTVFGEVVKGMEVADKIVSQPRDARDNPLERIEMTVKIVE
jgi:cyclophilin family peptidyl-prolyl cis-trans isomerase